LSAAAATAFNRVELNPVRIIHVTEFGISLNAAPNSTAAPIEFDVQRMSTVGTGAAGTVVAMQDDNGEALVCTALVENTADGTTQDVLHRVFPPNVSGIIWQAAPGREFDCAAADFLGIQNVGALPTGVNAATYIVWEE
jgi:hypothetical protein